MNAASCRGLARDRRDVWWAPRPRNHHRRQVLPTPTETHNDNDQHVNWGALFLPDCGLNRGALAMYSSSVDRATLASNGDRIPPCGVPAVVSSRSRSSVRMPALRNAFIQAQNAFVPDTTSHQVHQSRMVDLIETGLDVALDDPLIVTRSRRERAHLGHRVMCSVIRAKPVRSRVGNPPRR